MAGMIDPVLAKEIDGQDPATRLSVIVSLQNNTTPSMGLAEGNFPNRKAWRQAVADAAIRQFDKDHGRLLWAIEQRGMKICNPPSATPMYFLKLEARVDDIAWLAQQPGLRGIFPDYGKTRLKPQAPSP